MVDPREGGGSNRPLVVTGKLVIALALPCCVWKEAAVTLVATFCSGLVNTPIRTRTYMTCEGD
jgi:hypothetical protein